MNEKNHEEIFIFNRMAAGDKAAFRFFFEKYYNPLCRFVSIYVHDAAACEEIVEDVFIWFWEKRAELHIESSVKTYLFKAAKNKSLNHIRHELIKLKIHDKLIRTAVSSYNENPASSIDANRLRKIIDSCVNRLPEKCRLVFILAKEENLTYPEIALRQNISVKTVENQMGKALKLLREYLLPYYKELF